MHKSLWILALSAGFVLFAAEAASAQSVTVLGGGMARQCSNAALAGETDRRVEAVCTLALETEALSTADRAGTYVNRGVFKLRRGEFPAARSDFTAAADMKPDLGEAYANRGAAAIGERRYADGLVDINRALELGVAEPEKSYFNRALAHEALDDLKAAYFDYRKAAELSPDWAAPKKELARFTVRER